MWEGTWLNSAILERGYEVYSKISGEGVKESKILYQVTGYPSPIMCGIRCRELSCSFFTSTSSTCTIYSDEITGGGLTSDVHVWKDKGDL